MSFVDVHSDDVRHNVIEFEKLMQRAPQVDLKVEHYFSKGVYARELHIPKGIILTGKIHKYSQLNILLKGKIEVLGSTSDGIDAIAKTIEAPFVIVSPAGTKRIARALEDCIWITIHGTEETNLEKIEQTFIAQNEQEYLEFIEQSAIEEEPELPLLAG